MQMIHYAGASRWMKKAYPIAEFYLNNISQQFELERGHETWEHIKRSYAVRSYMPDSSREFIQSLQPWEKKSLYVEINGKKVTPTSLYFGIDTRLFRPDGSRCGGAYYHYGCALHPVFLPNGKRYREPQLSNVCADYKNGIVCNFYRE